MKLYDFDYDMLFKRNLMQFSSWKLSYFNLNINKNYVSQKPTQEVMSHKCSTCWCIVLLVLGTRTGYTQLFPTLCRVWHLYVEVDHGRNIYTMAIWKWSKSMLFFPGVKIARYLVDHDCPNYFCIRQK